MYVQMYPIIQEGSIVQPPLYLSEIVYIGSFHIWSGKRGREVDILNASPSPKESLLSLKVGGNAASGFTDKLEVTI